MISNLFASKNSKKQKKQSFQNTTEALKDFSASSAQTNDFDPRSKVLFDQKESLQKRFKKEFLYQAQRIRGEERELYSKEKELMKKELGDLKLGIQSLAKSTQNLEAEVQKAASQEPIEANIYQISFLKRLKNFIESFRKNLDEASEWLETQSTRKQKRFWGRVKKGGSSYLLSGEHSASRAAA